MRLPITITRSQTMKGSNNHALPPQIASLFWQGANGDAGAYQSFLWMTADYLRGRLSKASSIEEMLQDILLSMHAKRHTCNSRNDFDQWLHAVINYKIKQYDPDFR